MRNNSKQLLFEKQAEVVKAMAHPVRIAVIHVLKDGEKCVCDIAEMVGSERSNISRHLSIMVSAGILENRKEGLKMIYGLKTPCILEFFGCVSRCLKINAEENKQLLKML